MDKQEIIATINKYPTMQLATVDKQGQPHTRGMFMYSADESGVVFHTGVFKSLYKELLDQPQVELSFIDTEKFIQIRITGKAEPIEDQKFKEKIVNTPGREFLKPWIEQRGYEMLKVFKVVNCSATAWTWTTNFEYPKPEIKF